MLVPGTTKVIGRIHGEVRMEDLMIGSQVATGDGWSTITTFLHWHPSEVVDAVQITHDEGTLMITPDDLVFTVDTDGVIQSVPARNIQ